MKNKQPRLLKQGVRVRTSKSYASGDKQLITKVWISSKELGRLIGIVTQSISEGLGMNGQGEIELGLVNYDRTKPSSKGYLGIVRVGATKLQLQTTLSLSDISDLSETSLPYAAEKM